MEAHRTSDSIENKIKKIRYTKKLDYKYSYGSIWWL